MSIYIRYGTFVLILFLLNSCAFNKLFYATEYGKDAKFIAPEEKGDTQYEEFFLDTKNKKKIHCALFKTNAKKAKGQIVYFHGNAQPIGAAQGVAEYFAQKDYDCLLVDFQGYGQSTGKATHRTFLESGRRAAQYVKEQKLEIPVILYGFSIGGHLAVTIAEEHPNTFDLLMIEGAFSSHKEIAGESVSKGLKGIAKFITVNPYPGYKAIQNIKIPKLIIHSKKDEVAPFWMAEKYYENATEKKQIWEIKGGHGALLSSRNNVIEQIEKMLEK